jgi:hypothetical protein
VYSEQNITEADGRDSPVDGGQTEMFTVDIVRRIFEFDGPLGHDVA